MRIQHQNIMTEASIIQLALIFLFIADECQTLEYNHVRKMPRLQFDRVSAKPFYSCPFNFEASCDWYIEGVLINPSYFGYTWTKGNGYNTDDCSIEGMSIYTRPLFVYNDKDKIQCEGYGNDPVKVGLGGSIELYCSRNATQLCEWKRADERMIIPTNGRYDYIDDHQCSIRIDGIQPMDLGQWKCSNVDSIKRSAIDISIYTLALPTLTTEGSNPTTSRTETAMSANSDISSTYFNPKTYAVISEEHSNHNTTTIASKLVASVLGSVGVVTLIAVIIGVLWFIQKRGKRTKTTIKENKIDNTDDEVCRDLIQLESLATASTVRHSIDDSFIEMTAECQDEYTDGYVTPITHIINTNTEHTGDPSMERSKDTINVDNDIYDHSTANN